jgi:hypothetical protein
MQAYPPHFSDSSPTAGGAISASVSAGRADFGYAAGSAMSMTWSALHDAAAVVATLAGLQQEMRKPEIRNFPAIMRDTGGWRYEHARQGVDDLTAFMEPGLAALLAVSARGQSPRVPALALWHEFIAARSALLALIPPLGIKRRT